MASDLRKLDEDTNEDSEGLLDGEQCAIVLGSFRGGRGGPFIKRGTGNRRAYEGG